MASGRFPITLEKYAAYIDTLQEKVLNLPETERAYFLSLAQQTRDLFLSFFEQCVDLSELIADLCMQVALARYELEQSFVESLRRSSGASSQSFEPDQMPMTASQENVLCVRSSSSGGPATPSDDQTAQH
ncbi:hypothetical protein [Thermogutta sp.]|uniref:hypothetical protein n=1 Tax=Thermogutta sp. TaxID=1962930 RepID=UPI00321FC19E